ncbi:hypothetical protein L218DRAFT_1010041 [Marasmius fiardii PR-910]|nr:hypothetical protein L218DRAFT_1010041 [Marasmius fiardii PR-910]
MANNRPVKVEVEQWWTGVGVLSRWWTLSEDGSDDVQNVPGSQVSQHQSQSHFQHGQRHGSMDRRSVSFATASPPQIAEPPQFGIVEEIRETKDFHPHRFSQELNAESDSKPNSSTVSFTKPQPTEDVTIFGLPVLRLNSDRISTQS